MPSRGTYTFTFVPCRGNGAKADLLLTKLQVRRVEGDDAGTTWRVRRGFARGLVVDARQGDWIYPQLTSPGLALDGIGWSVYHRDLRRIPASFAPALEVRVDGDVLFLPQMQALVAGARATARVRLATVLPPMPLDGTPVTFTAATLGQWVVAPVTLDDRSYTLDATGWTIPGSWSGRASAIDELHCSATGPIGCGENSAGYVNARHPASGFFSVGYGGRNPWAVLLRVPSASTGSVDLALTPVG